MKGDVMMGLMTAASRAAKSSTHLVRGRGRGRGRARGRLRARARARARVGIRVGAGRAPHVEHVAEAQLAQPRQLREEDPPVVLVGHLRGQA